MYNWQKYLLSYLLLLSIVAAYIPFANLHHHDTVQCEISNSKIESASCHTSLYHLEISNALQCAHKSHILNESKHCDICKFIIEDKLKSRTKLKRPGHPVFWHVLKTNFSTHENLSFKKEAFLNQINQRGPPA